MSITGRLHEGPKKGRRSFESAPGEKHKVARFELQILPDDLWVKVREGTTVCEALRQAGITLGECGGLGKCGKCRVKVLTSVGPPGDEERRLLQEDELEQGVRLACRTPVERDMVVYLAPADSEPEYYQILRTGYRRRFHLNPLLQQRVVSLPSNVQQEWISSLDWVKHALGPEYQDLTPSLHCLRVMPRMVEKGGFRGAAVLYDKHLLAWQSLEHMHSLFGLVVDLGTTTLVGKLINMVDGEEVAVASRLNGQGKYGADVITRLQYVKEDPCGLENLHRILIDDLNQIVSRLSRAANTAAEEIFVAVVAGNTTMQHLFLQLDPSGIAEAPFAPLLTDGLVARSADVGLHLNPEALIHVMPSKTGYIGGDLISDVIASGAAEQNERIVLGMDFGTNGEIFLGNGRRMMTCSAAAGPAFEGAQISYGMIAAAGAIEAVDFDKGEFSYQVIGNMRPKGICGSGLVDLVAVLLELGVIDEEGLIRSPQEVAEGSLRSRIVPSESGTCDFLVASSEESYYHRPIYLTQQDVRQLQLGKGAIAAGTQILLDEMGLGVQDIDHVYLAGALGNYIKPDAAISIGLVPLVDPSTVSSLGNAASTGASMVLLSRDYWRMANELVDRLEHVELSSRLDFNERFVPLMDFPSESLPDIGPTDLGNMMRHITVGEAMTRDFPTVPVTMPIEEVDRLLRDTGHHGFPVLDSDGRLRGCITLADLEGSLRTGATGLTAGDIATMKPLVLFPDQSLHEALQASAEDYGRIPVVDPEDRSRLLGVLRRHDIVRAYRKRAAQARAASRRRSP